MHPSGRDYSLKMAADSMLVLPLLEYRSKTAVKVKISIKSKRSESLSMLNLRQWNFTQFFYDEHA